MTSAALTTNAMLRRGAGDGVLEERGARAEEGERHRHVGRSAEESVGSVAGHAGADAQQFKVPITRLDAELEPSASFRHEVPTTTPSPSAQRACLGRVVSPGAADVLADGRLARVNQRGDVVGVVVVAAGDRALELADTAAERAAGVGHALWAEDDEGDDEHDDELHGTDAGHGACVRSRHKKM